MSQSFEQTNIDQKAFDALESRLDDVWTLINRRDAANAKQACGQLNEQFPESSDGWFATSFLAFQLSQYDLSLSAIDKALECEPEGQRWLLHKAHTLLRMNRRKDAAEIALSLTDAVIRRRKFLC